MIALGIDPGTAITGVAIVREEGSRLVAVEYTCIRTSPDDQVQVRLRQVFDGILRVIERHRPDRMAIEQLFFNKNVRSAIAVGQARGVGLLAGAQAGLKVYEYTPLQVKQAVTGYGKASKEQVQEMVTMLLNLPEIPRPDDVADALAVAMCCIHSSRVQDRLDSMLGGGR